MEDNFYSFECFHNVFNDYVINYDESLKIFMQQSIDNTEFYFLKTQNKIWKNHFSELEEIHREIYKYSKHTKYYVDFLRNRIFSVDILEQLDNHDQEIDQEILSWISNYNEVDRFEKERNICLVFLNNRLATVNRVIDFLENRKQELEKESYLITGTNAPQQPRTLKFEEVYKTQNLFKVGLLFATGKMTKYFTVTSQGKTIMKEEFSAPRIAKELESTSFEKYILATINNYTTDNPNGNKNIFNSEDMMVKIINHCKANNLHIDPYFSSRFPID